LCKKSSGLFTQPIIFFYEVVLRKKILGVGKNLTAVRQARNEFLHNPGF
jgi:hypothetical protein